MTPAAPASIPLATISAFIEGVADATRTGFLNLTPATVWLRSTIRPVPIEGRVPVRTVPVAAISSPTRVGLLRAGLVAEEGATDLHRGLLDVVQVDAEPRLDERKIAQLERFDDVLVFVD